MRYEMHAYGSRTATLCGLALNQPHGRLPLATWPTGITCRNCLTLWYSTYLRHQYQWENRLVYVRKEG